MSKRKVKPSRILIILAGAAACAGVISLFLKYPVEYHNGDEIVATSSYSPLIGPDIEKNIPMEHYKFKGWYTDSGLTSPAHSGFHLGAIDLYGKYEGEAYSITYFDEKGQRIPGQVPASYEYGSEIGLPGMMKAGYAFEGWSVEESDSSILDPSNDLSKKLWTSIPKTVYGDLNLRAVYKESTYEVTYSPNGGTIDLTGQPPEKKHDEPVLKNSPIPVKGNSYFAGWFKDPDLTKRAGWSDTGDMTLYAGWLSPEEFSNYPNNIPDNFKTLPTEGTAGRIEIASYHARLFYGADQNVVSAENSAAVFSFGGKTVITDSPQQGMNAIKTPENSSMSHRSMNWIRDGEVQKFTKISEYHGKNTGSDLVTDDGTSIKDIDDSWLVTYTSNMDGSVTIVFWTEAEN